MADLDTWVLAACTGCRFCDRGTGARFLVGKSTQAVTFGISGQLALDTLVASVPLTIVSGAMLLYGMRIRSRIHPELYQALLRKVLWGMTPILVFPVLRQSIAQIFP